MADQPTCKSSPTERHAYSEHEGARRNPPVGKACVWCGQVQPTPPREAAPIDLPVFPSYDKDRDNPFQQLIAQQTELRNDACYCCRDGGCSDGCRCSAPPDAPDPARAAFVAQVRDVVMAWEGLKAERLREYGVEQVEHAGRCGREMNALEATLEAIADALRQEQK